MRTLMIGCVLVLSVACGGARETEETTTETETTTVETTGDEALPPDQQTAERTTLTPEECTAQGGTQIGDIGDGATQRPDYLCPNGQPPLGSVPVGIEGSVCCGS